MDRAMTELAKRVDRALVEDERTAEYGIEVLENAGIVTLTGTVGNQKTRQAAEEIARAQEGVDEVINDLEVHPEEDEEEMPAVPLGKKE